MNLKIVEIPRPKPVKSFGKYPNTIQAHPTDVLKEISRTKSQEKTLDDLRNELRNKNMGTESTLETFAQMKFHEDKIRNRRPHFLALTNSKFGRRCTKWVHRK